MKYEQHIYNMPYKCEHFIELAVSFDLFISPVVIFKMLSSARPHHSRRYSPMDALLIVSDPPSFPY